MAGAIRVESAVTQMPILTHLKELRRCFIISGIAFAIGFIVAISLYDYIMNFLFEPLLQLSKGDDGKILYINTLAEGFLVRLKISALVGFIVSLPIHIFNILYFVFPGLVRREKQIITLSLFSSFAFVVGGFLYSYYSIIPVSVLFLTGEGFIPENTGVLLSFSGNIFYILQFILMTLVVFQMPILLEVLMILKIVKRKVLFKLGRYMIVVFFLISALITPPDFITQIGLALPMTVLFYLTILIAKIFKFGES